MIEDQNKYPPDSPETSSTELKISLKELERQKEVLLSAPELTLEDCIKATPDLTKREIEIAKLDPCTLIDHCQKRVANCFKYFQGKISDMELYKRNSPSKYEENDEVSAKLFADKESSYWLPLYEGINQNFRKNTLLLNIHTLWKEIRLNDIAIEINASNPDNANVGQDNIAKEEDKKAESESDENFTKKIKHDGIGGKTANPNETNFGNIVNSLKYSFPAPISEAYFAFLKEQETHTKYVLLIQLFEVLIKYIAIVLLSFAISRKETLIPLKIHIEGKNGKNGKFAFGDWVRMIEILLEHSQDLSPILLPWTRDKLHFGAIANKSYKALSRIFQEQANIRNDKAHGAVLSKTEYKWMIEDQLAEFHLWINSLMFLSQSDLFLIFLSDYNEFSKMNIYDIRVYKGRDFEDQKLVTRLKLTKEIEGLILKTAYFRNKNSGWIVNLYPFVINMYCNSCKREQFFFFNGIKAHKAFYLSYECAHSIYGIDNIPHFKQKFSEIGISFIPF